MTDTAYKIKIMQAFENGKEIEICSPDGWQTTTRPNWNWYSHKWRIKPREPRVIYVTQRGRRLDERWIDTPASDRVKFIEIIGEPAQ